MPATLVSAPSSLSVKAAARGYFGPVGAGTASFRITFLGDPVSFSVQSHMERAGYSEFVVAATRLPNLLSDLTGRELS